MPKLALIAVLAASLAGFGCLSSSGSSPTPISLEAGTPDAGPPVQTLDGSVQIDGAVSATLTTGLGSGVIAHSAHFTIITKTGQVPGAGVASSANFKVISGAAPAAAVK